MFNARRDFMFKGLLNKLGYYKLNQLRAGGICGGYGKIHPREKLND